MRVYPFLQLIAMVVPAALASCGGSEVTFPSDRSPTQLQVFSGDGQQAIVGSEVPDPLVVRLTDAAARPVADIPLQFQTDAPEAEIQPAVIQHTNDSGLASVQVRLGTTTGTQTFEARLAGDGTSGLRAIFDLTALSQKKGKKDDGGDGRGHGRGRGHDEDDDD